MTNTGVSRFLNRAPRAQDTKEEQLITDGYASPWVSDVSDTAGRRRPDVLFLIMRIVRLEFCFFFVYIYKSVK